VTILWDVSGLNHLNRQHRNPGTDAIPATEVPNDLWLCDDAPFSVRYIGHARVM
jgi:hypothetical protein